MNEKSTQPRELVCWRVHPAGERIGRAVIGAGAVVAAALSFWVFTESVYWGVVACVVLILALNRFFFPSRFSIDEEGITARYPLRTMRLNWSDLRRFVHDQYGGYLSRRARPSRLDAYGGMHLLFKEDRDQIIAVIEAHLRRPTLNDAAELRAGTTQEAAA